MRSFYRAMMKFVTSRFLPFVCIAFALASTASAKSKLGEYFLGFSYFGGNGESADVDVLDVEVNNPISDTNDVRLGLMWLNTNRSGAGDDTSWWLDIDLVYHYDGFMNGAGTFRPYASAGIGYLDDSARIILPDDGFNWKLAIGSEIILTDVLSASVGLNMYGLWDDFSENDLEWEISMLYWFNELHGAGLEYRQSDDMEVNYFGLRYLYSWQ